MSPSEPVDENRGDVISVAVLGSDALLAALPAHPVQVAHACHALGFGTVVPASWGDEIVAGYVLGQLAERGRSPAVLCSCDRVRERLLASGAELGRFLISTVSPPVAVARYLRALRPRGMRLTYIGACDGGTDSAFDERWLPEHMFERLQEQCIDLRSQPAVFDSIVPPDRHRYFSLPSGCPAAEALWREGAGHQLVEIEEGDLVTELAQHLLTHDPVLVDVAPRLGCSCAGSCARVSARSARIAVMSLEPPRAAAPIIDGMAAIEVGYPLVTARSVAPSAAISTVDREVSVIQGGSVPADMPEPTDVTMDATMASAASATVVERRTVAVTPPRALAASPPAPAAPPDPRMLQLTARRVLRRESHPTGHPSPSVREGDWATEALPLAVTLEAAPKAGTSPRSGPTMATGAKPAVGDEARVAAVLTAWVTDHPLADHRVAGRSGSEPPTPEPRALEMAPSPSAEESIESEGQHATEAPASAIRVTPDKATINLSSSERADDEDFGDASTVVKRSEVEHIADESVTDERPSAERAPELGAVAAAVGEPQSGATPPAAIGTGEAPRAPLHRLRPHVRVVPPAPASDGAGAMMRWLVLVAILAVAAIFVIRLR